MFSVLKTIVLYIFVGVFLVVSAEKVNLVLVSLSWPEPDRIVTLKKLCVYTKSQQILKWKMFLKGDYYPLWMISYFYKAPSVVGLSAALELGTVLSGTWQPQACSHLRDLEFVFRPPRTFLLQEDIIASLRPPLKCHFIWEAFPEHATNGSARPTPSLLWPFPTLFPRSLFYCWTYICLMHSFVCFSFYHSPLKYTLLRAGALFYLLVYPQHLEYCLAPGKSSVNAEWLSEWMNSEQYVCSHRFDVLAVLFLTYVKVNIYNY